MTFVEHLPLIIIYVNEEKIQQNTKRHICLFASEKKKEKENRQIRRSKKENNNNEDNGIKTMNKSHIYE